MKTLKIGFPKMARKLFRFLPLPEIKDEKTLYFPRNAVLPNSNKIIEKVVVPAVSIPRTDSAESLANSERYSLQDLITNSNKYCHDLPAFPPYVCPNEKNILSAQSMIKSAPRGVYVGVGTERCLMTAAMNPNFTHVIMADYDVRIGIFNEINIALIKAAPDRKSYLELRLSENFNDFQSALKKCGYSYSGEGPDLNLEKHFSFFHENLHWGFASYHNGDGDYKYVSYLHNNDAFARIKNLADEGKIFTRVYDISNKENILKLEQDLKKRKLCISMYDISNAWWDNYVSEKKSFERSFVLGPDAFEKNGIIMVTDVTNQKYWEYFGFYRSQLETLHKSKNKVFRELFLDSYNMNLNVLELTNKNALSSLQ